MKHLRLTEEQLQDIQRRTARHGTVRTHLMDGKHFDPGHRKSKYNNQKTVRDGEKFDSKAEADRWDALQLLQKAGEIVELQRQVRFSLRVNLQEICCYIADYTYRNAIGGKLIVEDKKGRRTRDYMIKKKLMKALHGIEILET